MDAEWFALAEVTADGNRLVRASAGLCALLGRSQRELSESSGRLDWLAPGQHEEFATMIEHPDQHPFAQRRLTVRTAGGADVECAAVATVLSATDAEPTDGSDTDDTAVVAVVLRPLAAVELEQTSADRRRILVELTKERDRIGRDLHDRVIQRLFAVGMNLEVAAELLGGGIDVRERLWAAVEDVDLTMTEVRRAVFVSHGAGRRAGRHLEVLQATVESAGEILGYPIELVVVGPLSDLPPVLFDEMTAVARELLANVARHASSRAGRLAVTRSDDRLVVEVADDGIGTTEEGGLRRGTGLRSVRERAELLGGYARVEHAEPTGVRVTWSVPLPGGDVSRSVPVADVRASAPAGHHGEADSG